MRPKDQPDLEQELLDLAAMMNEPLDPELALYVQETSLGRCLRHPLVYQVIGLVPGMANRMLHQKRAQIDEALERGDLAHIVWMHERPFRTQALVDYVIGEDEYGMPLSLEHCTPEQRDLAASVWRDSENLEQWDAEWSCMLNGAGLLLCDDPEGFEALPDEVVVYRGDIEDGGWSWTTDVKIAHWFAQRFVTPGERPHPLLSGRVKKSNITGYLTSRGESEVLVREGLVEIGEGSS